MPNEEETKEKEVEEKEVVEESKDEEDEEESGLEEEINEQEQLSQKRNFDQFINVSGGSSLDSSQLNATAAPSIRLDRLAESVNLPSNKEETKIRSYNTSPEEQEQDNYATPANANYASTPTGPSLKAPGGVDLQSVGREKPKIGREFDAASFQGELSRNWGMDNKEDNYQVLKADPNFDPTTATVFNEDFRKGIQRDYDVV